LAGLRFGALAIAAFAVRVLADGVFVAFLIVVRFAVQVVLVAEVEV
jgi:hypothetical protein